ncbi:hypothetical protein B0T14DRAFT_524343 [Immersiella caudata]|uniref:Uncharacterized protein n=1 Tax=Immersiella caudata TaxID=314043 RepID=A0AA40BX76_9PEZI|nr:hypothetical protein B0T14DRAFT_524343 [Immersiella caudata]
MERRKCSVWGKMEMDVLGKPLVVVRRLAVTLGLFFGGYFSMEDWGMMGGVFPPVPCVHRRWRSERQVGRCNKWRSFRP